MAATGVIGDFTLPASREATSPPEARGLRRDEVRLLISRLREDSIEHARENLQEALELFFECAPPDEISRRVHSEVYVTKVEVAVA